MKAKNEIERWLKDEKFMAFANKRAKEEFFNSENNYYIVPQYEEMAEGFEDNDEYVVPMVDYLSYRLHRAKIYRKRRRSAASLRRDSRETVKIKSLMVE